MDSWLQVVELFYNTVLPYLVALIVMMMLDLGLGIIVALVQKAFDIEYITNYLKSDGAPIVGWLVYQLVMLIPTQFIPAGAVTEFLGASVAFVYATVFLKILGSIIGSLKKIGVLPNLIGETK